MGLFNVIKKLLAELNHNRGNNGDKKNGE